MLLPGTDSRPVGTYLTVDTRIYDEHSSVHHPCTIIMHSTYESINNVDVHIWK
jgi:hypothetical protein